MVHVAPATLTFRGTVATVRALIGAPVFVEVVVGFRYPSLMWTLGTLESCEPREEDPGAYVVTVTGMDPEHCTCFALAEGMFAGATFENARLEISTLECSGGAGITIEVDEGGALYMGKRRDRPDRRVLSRL